MKYLIVLPFLASCASGGLQPYEYDLEIVARYEDGQVTRKQYQVSSFARANKAGHIVLFKDGCLTQARGNKTLECGIVDYGIIKFDCLNCKN